MSPRRGRDQQPRHGFNGSGYYRHDKIKVLCGSPSYMPRAKASHFPNNKAKYDDDTPFSLPQVSDGWHGNGGDGGSCGGLRGEGGT